MIENGYIKLWRTMTKWRWYKSSDTKAVFLHFLLTANRYDADFEGTTIHRGQLVTSRETLSESLGISQQSVRTAIKRLKSTSEITSTSTSKYTIVTVIIVYTAVS